MLRNAAVWFAARGVTIERVLPDNGPAYKSHTWRTACTELGIRPKQTRPYRPQTNRKIERFHPTPHRRQALGPFYPCEQARRKAQAARLHSYNHHRPHTRHQWHHPIDQPPWEYT